MSLLMDALKKAEQTKRQNQDEGEGKPASPSEFSLELEPLANPPAASPAAPTASLPSSSAPVSGTLPELPKHLEALDDEFLAHHASQAPKAKKVGGPAQPEVRPPTSAPARDETAARQANATKSSGVSPADKAAAQNAFAAKQPTKLNSKAFGIIVGMVTLIALLCIGIYFWLQLQPKSATSGGLMALFKPSPLPPPRPAAGPAQPVGAATPPAAVVTTPPPPSPAPTRTVAVPPPPTDASPSAKPPARMAAPARDDEDEDDRPPPSPARAKVAPAPVAAGERPVRVTKLPPRVNPTLSEAFDAWTKGDFVTALSGYERVLKSDPRNSDALHGLAAVALRQKRFADAEQVFRRLLDIDPKDPVATAELINLRGQSDPLTSESRLKSLIAAQPDLAQAHFALGNLYAAQGRWNDAQNAYFKAYTAEADNPDILFNLAVSLEHLRQNRLALQYYQQALALAQNRPAGFDKAQAGARIRALQP